MCLDDTLRDYLVSLIKKIYFDTRPHDKIFAKLFTGPFK